MAKKYQIFLVMIFILLLFITGLHPIQRVNISTNLKGNFCKLIDIKGITPQDDFIAPIWSTTGLDLVISKSQYMGLYLVSSTGGDITLLTDEEFSGYNPLWSNDGYSLIYKTLDEKKFEIFLNGIKRPYVNFRAPEENKDLIAFAQDDEIYLGKNENVKRITDGNDLYFNPLISPDGRFVLYEGISTGIYILELSSQKVINVGRGNHPKWSPDGTKIIYDITEDDGHNILSGDLFLFDLNTKNITQLTNTPNMIEQRPDWSPVGNKIAFDADGIIYVGTLK